MIHKLGSKIKYFTRNAKDYTDYYAPKFDHVVLKHVTAKRYTYIHNLIEKLYLRWRIVDLE